MGEHLIDGEFQSDKYPDTPRGLVPLKPTDKMAQDLLWEYARRREEVDEEFSEDLREALRIAGYVRRDGFREAIEKLVADVNIHRLTSFCVAPDPTREEEWEEHRTALLALEAMLS